MSTCIFRDGTAVSDGGRPYIISEVNSSHNGSMELARQMIDASAEIGCDCVKFQSWSVSSLYSQTYYAANPIAKRFVQKFSMSPAQLKELAEYCRAAGVAFSSTPYSEEEVDFLIDECGAPFVKIASMEINDLPFLRYIGKKHVPVILSTGMADYEETDRAVSVLREAGAEQMVILHCVSIYPTVLTSVNLNNIAGLRARYGEYPIGFSDHTRGDEAGIAAVALGAAVLEKHLTLDRSKVGMDNNMATEPGEFREYVRKCRSIQLAMGTQERVLLPEELAQRSVMRRSIVSAREIRAGEIIRAEDLCAKRPGTGFPPDRADCVIGQLAAEDIPADTVIRPEQLKKN